MLTKPQIQEIKALQQKKYRSEKNLFTVEGEKNLTELLTSDYSIKKLYITSDFKKTYAHLFKKFEIEHNIVSPHELSLISNLESNDAGVAVVTQKDNASFDIQENEIVLALDDIRDPGNLGTIIRIADWYGIKKIIASTNTTDLYNSKTIAASMGSFTRVSVFYTDLKEYFKDVTVPVFGTYLEGENVHATDFPKGGVLLMGNESNGISKNLKSVITKKITIPSFGYAESLNVGVATAIILDNWRRSI